MTTRRPGSAFEVVLDGVRFQTIGGVLRNMSSQWAPKVTQGDTDRDSDPHRSTLGFADFRGGIGLDIIEGSGDTNRTWFSTHDTKYRGHLIHTPLAIGPASSRYSDQRTIPIPSGSPALISFIQDFGNEVYVGFGAEVRKWGDSTNTWSSVEHTLPDTPTDVLVTRLGDARTLYMIIACGSSGYTYFDGTTWEDATTASPEFLTRWDNRIWALDSTGQLSHAITPDGTWTDDAWLPLPDDYANALFTTKLDGNTKIIAVVSQDGSLWTHDADNQKFIETSLDLPIHPDTGVGATSWREAVFIPSGLAVYLFNSGAVGTLEVVGPDRNAGLPQGRSGRITRLVPTQTALLAFVEGESEQNAIGYMTPGLLGTLPPLIHRASFKTSTILELVNRGWHTMWAGGQDGGAGTDNPRLITGVVSSAYDEYRLWFATATQLWYIDLPRYNNNPTQLPIREYAAMAETVSPWFDANIAAAVKVALSILVDTSNLVGDDAFIAVDIAYDYDETVWTEIARFQDSLLSEPETVPALNEEADASAGTAFRALRLRWRSELGDNQKRSPDMRSTTLEYYKRLGILQKYEFRFIVDLSRRHGGRTQGQLKSVLSDIVSKPEMVSLVYKDEEGQDRTYYVRTVAESRFEHTGEEPTASRSSLVFVEL